MRNTYQIGESKIRTYYGRVAAGRRTAVMGRGGAEQDGTLTSRPAKETTAPIALLPSRAPDTTVLNVFSEA